MNAYNFYLLITKTDNDVTLTYIKKYRINVHLTWTTKVKGSKRIGNLWTEGEEGIPQSQRR